MPHTRGVFGALLQQHRHAAGLSQEELAERAGLSRRGISDLERGGRRAPYPETVRRLADSLELSAPERAALLAASRRGAIAGAPAAARQSGVLPMALSSFVGREREIGEVRRLLARTRLLTLTGPGGIGKTRLAIEAAGADSEAVFVDLAPLNDGRLVPAVIAEALAIDEQPRATWLEVLTTSLVSGSLLLILDNCEHLVAACAETTERLLRTCPRLRVLATSRQPLAVVGEQLWPVPPLATTPLAPNEPDALPAAVRLFIERAQLVSPEFLAVDEQAIRSTTEVCRQLDGLPLAIELAAARIRTLGLEGLRLRLAQGLQLPKSTTHGVPARHQTVAAAIDWSYELLTEAERSLLCSLSVFSGGWTVEATEVVCADEKLASPDVLETLERLLERSLVQAAPDATGTARYAMLETVRQFARERLDTDGRAVAVFGRHAAYYLHLAEQAERDLKAADQVRVVTLLERELDNLRAAMGWSVAHEQTDVAVRLGAALWQFWLLRGHTHEGRGWLTQVLQLATVAPMQPTLAQARAEALAGAGFLAMRQGDFAAARTLSGDSLRIRRELGDAAGVAMCLNDLGVLADDAGEYAAALDFHEQSLAIRRELGDRARIAASLGNLGSATMHSAMVEWLNGRGSPGEQQRQYAVARRMLEEGLAIRRELNDVQWIAATLINLGVLADLQADYASAHNAYVEALVISRELGDRDSIGAALEGLSTLAAAQGQAERAMRLGGAAATLREALGTPLPVAEQQLGQHRATRARQLLGDVAAEAAWAAGRVMPLDQIVADELGHARELRHRA